MLLQAAYVNSLGFPYKKPEARSLSPNLPRFRGPEIEALKCNKEHSTVGSGKIIAEKSCFM